VTDSATGLRRTALAAEHRALGAKLVEFGGWEMPIQYRGVLEEHRACRTDAVIFDVSHLVLQRALTNDLGRIGPGRAQYTHLLDPADAHVVDDVIVWWRALDDFLVMPNASNTARIAGALREAAAEVGATALRVEDITDARAVIAVQGPNARARAATVDPAFGAVARFRVATVDWDGVECVVAGTGYTGEPGIEIQVPAVRAAALWRALLTAGCVPAGLGARDTLRLEAGLPLHGHELGEGITTLQAGLGWVVGWDKGDFRGRAPLAAESERGVSRRLRGLLVEGRRPPRAHCPVLIDGAVVGEVTSGNFSPTLGQSVALAFLPPDVADGTAVEIDVRGKPLAAVVTKPPFV
jgi:aminomethyltransferase